MSVLSRAVGTDEERKRRLECLRNTASASRAMETEEEKLIRLQSVREHVTMPKIVRMRRG